MGDGFVSAAGEFVEQGFVQPVANLAVFDGEVFIQHIGAADRLVRRARMWFLSGLP